MFRILALFFRVAHNLSLSQYRGNERLSTKRPTLESILLAFWQFLRKLSDIAIHRPFAVYALLLLLLLLLPLLLRLLLLPFEGEILSPPPNEPGQEITVEGDEPSLATGLSLIASSLPSAASGVSDSHVTSRTSSLSDSSTPPPPRRDVPSRPSLLSLAVLSVSPRLLGAEIG